MDTGHGNPKLALAMRFLVKHLFIDKLPISSQPGLLAEAMVAVTQGPGIQRPAEGSSRTKGILGEGNCPCDILQRLQETKCVPNSGHG